MKEPLVSVVIPTYNRAAAVVRALGSVFAQDHDHLQVIVVDDASHDDTETRVRGAYGDRVQYVRDGVRRGPGAARNRGVALSRGAYVAFLDSDDQWLRGKLTRQLALAARGSDVIYGTALHANPAGDVVAVQRARPHADLRRPLLERNVVVGSASAVLMRRACLEAVGGFRTDIYSEDWELWLRLSFRFAFASVAEPLVTITADPQGRHRTAPPEALALSLGRIYEGLLADPVSAEFAHRHRPVWRASLEYYTGAQHCLFGQTAPALRRFARSIAARPLQVRAYLALMLLAAGEGAARRAGRSLARRARAWHLASLRRDARAEP